MQRSPSLMFVACFYAAVAVAPRALCGIDKIPAEAVREWESLIAAVSNGLTAHLENEWDGNDNGKPHVRPKDARDFTIGDDGAFVTRIDRDGHWEVAAFNADYYFDASKVKEDDTAPPRIGNLFRGRDLERMATQVQDLWRLPLNAAFELLGMTMKDLTANDRFTLDSFELDEAERRAVMTFHYARKDDVPDTALTGGRIAFSVDKGWSIDDYDCTTSYGRCEGKVRTRPFKGSFVPEFVEQRDISEDGKRWTRDVYWLSELREVAAGTRVANRLENYGLSVPAPRVGVARNPSRWGVVTLNVILCAALFLGVGVLRRRRNYLNASPERVH